MTLALDESIFQDTVKSLEELNRQSKINYTVMKDSPYLEYFENMANAEEALYSKWKEMTLNSGGEETKQRVFNGG